MASGELIAMWKRDDGCCLPLRVKVSPYMVGAKRPVLSGCNLFVSPAMHELIAAANEDELKHLLSNLIPINIPGLFDIPKWPAPVFSDAAPAAGGE